VAFETKLPHTAAFQHLRIRRAVRGVARRAAFHLERRMFENERALLIAMALDTGGVGTDGELRLFLLKASVRIVTIAAGHRSFEHLVMERFAELGLCFGVARHAKLRLVRTEHRACRLSGFLVSHIRREGYRAGTKSRRFGSMRTVAFSAADVIAPVLAATKVIVILFSRVAGQTCFGDRLRVESFEGNDLGLIAARIDVFLSGAVTCLTSDNLPFPGSECVKAAVLCPFEHFELCFVTRRAGFRSHVVVSRRSRSRCRGWLSVSACVLGYGSECQPYCQ